MKTMTIEQFIASVDDGKYFSVEFVKKDGSLRKMNARRGVSKGVKNDTGTNGSWNRKAQDSMHGVLTVYDVQKLEEGKDEKGAFRRINLDTIKAVSVHGTRYKMNVECNLLTAE